MVTIQLEVEVRDIQLTLCSCQEVLSIIFLKPGVWMQDITHPPFIYAYFPLVFHFELLSAISVLPTVSLLFEDLTSSTFHVVLYIVFL